MPDHDWDMFPETEPLWTCHVCRLEAPGIHDGPPLVKGCPGLGSFIEGREGCGWCGGTGRIVCPTCGDGPCEPEDATSVCAVGVRGHVCTCVAPMTAKPERAHGWWWCRPRGKATYKPVFVGVHLSDEFEWAGRCTPEDVASWALVSSQRFEAQVWFLNSVEDLARLCQEVKIATGADLGVDAVIDPAATPPGWVRIHRQGRGFVRWMTLES